jgi:flagellar operon protein
VTEPLQNPALLRSGPVGPSQPAVPTAPATGPSGTAASSGPSFAEVLVRHSGTATAPRFSRHALERLQRRGIELNQQTLGRLADGMSRAAGKGSRDSVVFVDGTAFVVSVSNNTVVTAVGSEHMREHVFTNIDSAVIA